MNSCKKDTTRADLDWENLPFGYIKTDYNIRYYYKDGTWSGGELVADETIPIHMAAPALNYGQQAFEGLKVFATKDGRSVVFRPDEHAKRLNHSGKRIIFPDIPEKMFIDAVHRVVKANARFVPPYGTGASLYIRPLILGIGPKVGLGPAPEYMFMIYVVPVGPYYKSGFKPVKALIVDEFDRAAPLGVGDCKLGGNYAAGLRGQAYGHEKGFQIVLYLDSKEKKYIDEFGTSNFIGIKGSSYITPKSTSILSSITNKSLCMLAEKKGMRIERRPIAVEELDDFEEVGAVGTAAVLTPVCSITYKEREYTFGTDDQPGPVLTGLYNDLISIQTGHMPDPYGWLDPIEL